MAPLLPIKVLTREQMLAVDQRQAQQQAEWKALPAEGVEIPSLSASV